MAEFIRTNRGRRVNADLLPPEERFITTRGGHDINVGLLSPGELKQIRRTRAITPQEFIRSEEKDFVFLVRDRETEKRTEVHVEKTKCLEKQPYWIKWMFQGLYETADKQLVVLRSHSFQDGEFQCYIFLALNATVEEGRVVEGCIVGHFGFGVNQKTKKAYCWHRRTTLESKGVGSEMLDKMEKCAASAGAAKMQVDAGWRQEDTRRLISKRGYRTDDNFESAIRNLPKAHEDDDMALFHKFPTKPSGRREYYSERINR
ncbi:MAG: hypothetical protein FJY77_04055 [Candidatus Altiarchaeales archaeon]|nr:hypothetical protein [Candidatus Altiarchaeales archaeon]